MLADSRFLQSFFCLASAYVLHGCATHQPQSDTAQYTYPRRQLQMQREASLQSSWRGKNYRTLVENFGRPTLTMEVPGRRHLASSVAVYGVVDRASDCIDAFSLVTVPSGDIIIADYFCR